MGALRYHRSSNYRKQQPAMTRETKGESCSIETQKHKEASTELVLRPLRNGHCMAGAGIRVWSPTELASSEGQLAGLLSVIA